MADLSTMTQEQMIAEIARLQKANTEMAARQAAKETIRFKVSEKGAVSIYGLNSRFPVTLYKGQWERLVSHIDDLKAFMAANDAKLATKPVKE
jgi:hypothetical protein